MLQRLHWKYSKLMETGGHTDGLIRLMYWFLLYLKITIVNAMIYESKIKISYVLW